MSPVWKATGDLIAQGTEKAELFKDFFPLVFTNRCSSHTA